MSTQRYVPRNNKIQLFKYATVAALTTLTPPCTGYLQIVPIKNISSSIQHDRYGNKESASRKYTWKSSKSFSSWRDNNDDSDQSSLFKRTTEKLKSLNPFRKKESNIVKQKAKAEISDGIDALFKDAPLGARLLSKMIKPIVGSVVGNIAQAMEDQSREMEDLLNNARTLILRDTNARRELGQPLEVGMPFSQSSSSMNINGQKSSQVQSSFEIRGSLASGIATMEATNGDISSLTVNVNGGGYFVIDTVRREGSSNGSSGGFSKQGTLGRNNIGKDDVIDVEFVEKK